MPLSEDDTVAAYLPLVRRLALQMAARLPANVELDDLVQAGLLGLLDALRRYQQTPDAQFETYATTRIRGAMLDELRAQDWLPRTVRSKARSIEQAIAQLEQTLGRAPMESEIAQQLGLPLADYQQLLEQAHGVQVLHYEDLARAQGGNVDVLDFLQPQGAQGGADPAAGLMLQALRAAVVQAIAALPERERLLLSLQFEQDLNQKEIAVVLGVTEGRVSQLRSQAIARIRAHLVAQGWPDRPDELSAHSVL